MELDLKSKTPAAAAARAEAIRTNVQQAALVYAKAVQLEDWRTLHRDSLAVWAQDEFGPNRFSADRRKEIVALLTDVGMTQREIAAATGAGTGTVARDQQENRAPNGAQERTQTTTPKPRQRAAREREATKRTRPGPSGSVEAQAERDAFAKAPPALPPAQKRQTPKPPGPRRRFCLEGDRLDDSAYIARRLMEEVDRTVLDEVIILLGGSVKSARKLRSV